MRILHLEDSANDAELTQGTLRKEWPGCVFERVEHRADYQAALDRGDFNLILSDYTLPDFNGLTALELARARHPDKPFIFLSGTIGEERAIEALKLGATDYLLKDRPNRLVPAVRQALAHIAEAQRHQEAEAQIHEQAALLDKARDAICVTDLAQRVTYWNAGAERLFGWSAADMLGQDLPARLFPKNSAPFREAHEKLRAAGEWSGELRPRNKAGETVIVESRWTLVTTTGTAQHILLISTDVTEKKKLETQFLRAQRMESIGTLASGIAHDLNNVLNPILGAAVMLRSRLTAPSDQELVSLIEGGASHGAALIKQLLAFGRGADGVHLEVKLPPLLADVGHLLRTVLPRTIELSTRCADDLHSVRGDVTQLNQVLINLCVNARDAMPCGGRISILADNFTVDEAFARNNSELSPGSYVRLTVIDNGSGIPPELMDKIFDPFFTTKEHGKGTGLGLVTVRGIVKGHGGALEVDSAIGRGTAFRIYLPAWIEPAPQPAPPPADLPSPPPGEGVLVIDDDRAMRSILRLMLENAGARVFLAVDGTQGLGEFRRHRHEIGLVVTDMMMPGMSGPEVIVALRALEPGLRIIAISALMEQKGFHLERVPGPPVECLAKPISREVLFAAIERLASKRN